MVNQNKELKLVLVVLLLHMIPLIAMCFPNFPGAFYSPYSGVFSLLSWICVPVFSSVVLIGYIMHEGWLSWLSGLELMIAALAYTAILRDKDADLFCAGLILQLGLEMFQILKQLNLKPVSDGIIRTISEMLEDWKFLTSVYFWAVLFVFSVQWLLMGNSQYTSFGVIVVVGPLPVIMTILPGTLKKPLTAGGWLGVLVLMAVAICVCVSPYSGGCWGLYLGMVMAGFALMSARLWLKNTES